jgi:hypothetical protein
LYLDHLTVAALTVDEGVDHVRRSLGVVMPPGGAHPLMGTHNHLMRLGARRRIIAVGWCVPDCDRMA